MAARKRIRLTAEPRSGVHRKSELKALRRSGIIPAVLFGHGEPQMIQIPARTVREYLHHHTQSGVLDLDLGGKVSPAIIRELDRHPVTGEVIHLGFQRVDMDEMLKTSISLRFTGEEVLMQDELVVQHQMTELEVQGRADHLPESIEVDLSQAKAGDSIRIADLSLPDGVLAMKDPDSVVATVRVPSVPADVEAALDAEEAAHAEVEEGTEEEKEMEPDTVEAAEAS